MSNSKTRVVFVQDKFFLAGIEVLELKLIEELSRRGYDVVLVSRKHEELNANTSTFSHFVHKGYPDFISRSPSLVTGNQEKLVFVSLHPTAAMAAEIAGRKVGKARRASPGIYHFHWVSHSRAFFFSRQRLVQILFEAFFKLLPVKSTFFMNEAAADAHQSFWRRSLEEYPTIRIVGRRSLAKVRVEKDVLPTGDKSRVRDLRIVSVGRLVPFKSYNVNAPEIVRRLKDFGVNATWDIWGYGPEEPEIVLKSRQHNVTDRVRLRGTVAHAKFDETVSSYDVFVGMGTSVLEAAKTGIPSCVAVESRGDACYGFLHEAPSDSVGDHVDGFSERGLHEVLHSFSLLSSEARVKIGEADALAAQERESTLDDFVNAVLSAAPMKAIGLRERMLLAVVRVYLIVKHWKLQRSAD